MILTAGMALRKVASAVTILSFVTASYAAEGQQAAGSQSQGTGTAAAASPENHELIELKQKLADQQRQIEELRQMLLKQQRQVDATARVAADAAAKPAVAAAPVTPAEAKAKGVGEVASAAPVLPRIPDSALAIPAALPSIQDTKTDAPQTPLQLKIGDSYITPIGFMDLTSISRNTTSGSSIGTNFGSIPYSNTANGHLSETRLSTQNSRIGARFDSVYKGMKILGYWESDFNGFVPTNAGDSTNSDTFRLRLFFADIKKDQWEILGGQTWSLMTPGRKGISPVPGDLFYSQAIDLNYLAGLTFTRASEFRFVYHPSNTVALAFAAEQPEQYIGGSGGAGVITLPSALSGLAGTQLNNGSTTLGVPNMHPDLMAKVAFDPKVGGLTEHIEFGGLFRTFKVFNTNTNAGSSTSHGAAVQANVNLELAKNFHLISNNYWGDGGGRYIYGLAPDLVVRPDGSISPVHSGSTIDGLEYTYKNTLLYSYYSGVYIGRNVVVDTNGKLVGYGYSGASNAQNKSIQEVTFGLNQAFWKNPRYGALNFMLQYSYLTRAPWYLAAGQPTNASQNMVFLDLRYTLPGSAPSLK